MEACAQRVAATVDSTASVIDYTGSATLHDWTGTSRDVSGTMVLDLDTPDSSRVVVRAPVASFESGPNRRDRRMREVTEAGTYPIVEFRTTAVQSVRWGRTSEGHAGRWRVTGDLTFHGQTHPVEADVTVRTTGDSVRARARFPVSLTQFDVERPELLWMAPIGDTIRIDARVSGAIASVEGETGRVEADRSEGTGTQSIASTDLRSVTPIEYAGSSASLFAEARRSPEGEWTWMVALYGFADQPIGLADAQTVTLTTDRQSVDPYRVEGSRRRLDDGTVVEISRMYVTRSAFETLAEALTVTATVGAARFSADWTARHDLRRILQEVPADSSRPVSSHESN
jgi:polyisoprenoid-binding protein YceI